MGLPCIHHGFDLVSRDSGGYASLVIMDGRATALKQLDFPAAFECQHDEPLQVAGFAPVEIRFRPPSRSDLRLTTVCEQFDAIHETGVLIAEKGAIQIPW